jgi:indolepyruvate ferredoxin oxidoreductase
VASIVRSEPGSRLEHLVDVRVSDLIGYQSAAYAERYARAIERVRAAEAERVPGHSELAEAAAFGLYKLMAYKDEYEVARLHLEDAFSDDVRTRFGADASFGFLLHPPMLKALGMQRKIKIPGRPGIAMFRALATMKWLRGTRLDPFGRDHVRVVERELIREFEELLEEIVDRLRASDHGVAVDLARLPDMVRGYDEVKMRNVDLYHQQMGRLRAQLSDGRLQGEPLRILG